MKNLLLMNAASLLFLLFLIKYDAPIDHNFSKEIIREVIQKDTTLARNVLLDSAILRMQARFIENDSTMTVYLINQLEFRPDIARKMISNLYRHYLIDSICAKKALQRMNQFNFIDQNL